jgi:NADPH:quinone reductase-like Zn-dependent oxidoreductase
MKAAVYHSYGSPDVVRVEETPTPVPRDNEVLVRIHAATVVASDSAGRQGAPFLRQVLLRPAPTEVPRARD